ncbi:hypothetical protein HELRODRAFT_191088 [Helobdella robusta]|uniref:CUB domain-containing protein n=1 Tax=Helobdella robusta TaxID=6412 RepID=T1FSK8_HELRO|nr:hypothetical protein HELRODRAFT_191088 [Helobdella robusta]ESO07194.1 hypothetical protein HELRODRAFT_191088 [Helobdella robusta]
MDEFKIRSVILTSVILVFLEVSTANQVCEIANSPPYQTVLKCPTANVIFIYQMYFFKTNDPNSFYAPDENCRNNDVYTKYKSTYLPVNTLNIYEESLPTNFGNECGGYLKFLSTYYCIGNTTSIQLSTNTETNKPTINFGNFFIMAYSTDPNPSFAKVEVTVSRPFNSATFRIVEVYAKDTINSTCPYEVILTQFNQNDTTCMGPRVTDNYLTITNSRFSISVTGTGTSSQMRITKAWLWVETTPSTSVTLTVPETPSLHSSTRTPLITPSNPTDPVTSMTEFPLVNENRAGLSGLSTNAKIGIGVGVAGGSVLLILAVLLTICCCLKRRGKEPKNMKEPSVIYNISTATNELNNSMNNNNNYSSGSNAEPSVTVQPIPMLKNKFPVSPVNETTYDNGKEKNTKYKAVRQKSKNKKTLMDITQNFMQDADIYYPLDETNSPNFQANEIDGPINAWDDQNYDQTAGKLNSYPVDTWEYDHPKNGPVKSLNMNRVSMNELEHRRSLTDDGDDGTNLHSPASPVHYQPGKTHFQKNSKMSKKTESAAKQKVKKAKSVTFGNYPSQPDLEDSWDLPVGVHIDNNERGGNMLF